MRLLLDQNLSPRLARALASRFPGSEHVRSVSLERASDSEIWSFAASGGFVIVTKDSDFHQRSFLHGAPPKVVWLRVGNCTTSAIEEILLGASDTLLAFESDPTASFLVLT